MTLQRPLVTQHGNVSWMTPASALWVASRRGNHLGMVERIQGRYVATDGRGRTIGEFDELEVARAAVDGVPGSESSGNDSLVRWMSIVLAGALIVAAVAAGGLVLFR